MFWHQQLGRRGFLGRGAQGVGAYALASMMDASSGFADPNVERWPGVIRPTHVEPKAKRVIFLVMAGGASHLETFDEKPKLAAMDGQPMPTSVTEGQQVSRGDVVGRSGATGLAGGDHLHFTMLLQGLPVDPREWWDSHWIGDRLKLKLGRALPFDS